MTKIFGMSYAYGAAVGVGKICLRGGGRVVAWPQSMIPLRFRYPLYLLLALLCGLVQSSCVRFNLTEQLEPPDMQVPVVCRSEHGEQQYSLWRHGKNYYARLPFCYATREFRVLGARTPSRYEYDRSAQ